VFISHRGADQVSPVRLAEALRRCGRDVWIDAWKIQIRDIGKINDGLTSSCYLVLCCSAGSSPRAWMGQEWGSAFAPQLDGAHVKGLPFLLTGGALSPILADRKYAGLVADWSGGVDAI
jgi:TIR domain